MALVKYNNNSISAVTALDSIASGSMVLLTTNTISSGVSSSSFTSNIDSTYDTYVFKFINIHPATDNVRFEMNMSADSGSNYNVAKTTTFFQTWHNEADSETTLQYATTSDLAQGTGTQRFNNSLGNDSDQSISGTLHLFNPSSTTFVKHFISTFNQVYYTDYSMNMFVAGYGNTTSAIDAIQFSMSSGNIDSGVIKMYGLSKS